MRLKRVLKDISICFLGCVFSSFGTACFLLPNKLSSGGFSGIATIFYYLFNDNILNSNIDVINKYTLILP